MQHWFVIHTRLRWEKKVAKRLVEKGIETFCPLLKEQRQWSDRVKTIERPLLKSCLFVRITDDQRTLVRLTDGVLNFVYKSGKPVVIKEKTVQLIRRFQQAHQQVRVVEDKDEQAIPLLMGLNGKAAEAILRIEHLNILLVGDKLPGGSIGTSL